MLHDLYREIEKERIRSPHILDLSVEGGHFPLAMSLKWQKGIHFYGVDRDPIATEMTRRLLKFALHGRTKQRFRTHTSCRDSLLDQLPQGWPLSYDAIVGNPPWVARKPVVSNLVRKKFWPMLRGHYDMYLAFMLRAHELLKPGGYLCYVVPSAFLFNCSAAPIRGLLLEHYDILALTTFPQCSFVEVPCIIPVSFLARKIARGATPSAATRISNEDIGLGGPDRPHGSTTVHVGGVWKRLPSSVMNPVAREENEFLASQLSGTPLGELGKVTSGARFSRTSGRASPAVFQAIHARNLRPYHACLRNTQSYGHSDAVFDRPPDAEGIRTAKVVFQEMRYVTHRQRLIAALADRGTYPVSTAGLFVPVDARDILFYVALLNSALVNAWYKLRDVNRAIKITYLRELPVPQDRRAWHLIDKLARRSVELRTDLHMRLASCTQRRERVWLASRFPSIWEEIVANQRKIDDCILRLYRVPMSRHKAVFRLAAARVF